MCLCVFKWHTKQNKQSPWCKQVKWLILTFRWKTNWWCLPFHINMHISPSQHMYLSKRYTHVLLRNKRIKCVCVGTLLTLLPEHQEIVSYFLWTARPSSTMASAALLHRCVHCYVLTFVFVFLEYTIVNINYLKYVSVGTLMTLLLWFINVCI